MTDKAYFELNKSFTSAQTGIARVLAPVTGNLVRAFVKSDIELDGGNALFDVNKNGASIFGDPDDGLKIEDGDKTGDVSSLAVAVTQYTDLITVDFDGFTGTAVAAGGRLTLVLEFEESGGAGGAARGALVKLTSAQAIADDQPDPAALLWADNGATVRDDGGFVVMGENSLTIPAGETGWYDVLAQVRWEGDASGQRRVEIAYTDGDDDFVIARQSAAGLGTTDPHRMQVAVKYYLEEGWAVYVKAWQNSGSSLDVQSTGDESWFAITPAGKS